MPLLVSLTSQRATYFALKLDGSWTEIFGVNPYDGTNSLDSVSAFIKPFSYLLAGEGVWGRGRHLSPRPQQPFRNLFVILVVLKKHDRCASRFGFAFSLLLEFFRRSIAQSGVQPPLPIVILLDELFDVRPQMFQVIVFVGVDFFPL